MKKIYDLMKKISDEFKCFEVQCIFAQEEDDNEEFYDVFNIVLFSTLSNDPIEISITTNPEMLEKFDVETCLRHLRFELSCRGDYGSEEFYYPMSNRVN